MSQAIVYTSNAVQELNDGCSADKHAIRSITQSWIDEQMRLRENEFLKTAECSLFCGTWNVNAKKQEVGLEEWILPSGQPPADIYAIGFQEIVDLNVVNVGLNSANTIQKAEFWQKALSDALTRTGQRYQIVADKFLVGILLFIFVREPIVQYVTDIRTTTVAVGIMGMMGNKGGALIRFSVYDSCVVIVCSHLAAHRENVAGRNSDFKIIYEKALFSSIRKEEDIASAIDGGTIVMPSQGAARYLDKDLTVNHHDLIFWIGDLNYRIDDSLSTEEVFGCIEAIDLETLRGKDQLNIERKHRRAFQGFEEGTLNFLPTYKYQPGTDNYERRPEKKLRAPAWCDRILWKRMSNKESVQLLDYRRSNLVPSDHKPVSARFQCTLRRVVATNEQTVFQNLSSLLSTHTTSKAPPTVDIMGLKVNLGRIGYEEEKSVNISIRNTGESIVYWRFVPKLDDVRISKRWIKVDRFCGLLLPGETSRLKLTALVDKITAQQLNGGKDSLQDLLTLRVEKSLDYFVEVSGDYQRSCYGMAMEELVTLVEPVSTVPLPQADSAFYLLENAAAIAAEESKTKLSIPKELWRLVDALWSGNALKEKGLFNTPPDLLEVAAVRQALDEGIDFSPSASPHDIVACLLGLLSALPRPLLPPALYPTNKLDASQLSMASRKFLEDLPPLNYNVFVYLVSFFREVLAEESYNRCSAAHLAEVCIENMTSNILFTDDVISDGVVGSSSSSSSLQQAAAAATERMVGGNNGIATIPLVCYYYYDDVVVLTKEEKLRRIERQSYLYDIIEFLLTTPNL
jgi:phosphatidylinositol-bisphosphatase